MYFKVYLAATNFHVGYNPLRREDGEYYSRHELHLNKIGKDIEETKKRKWEQYCDNRRARLEITPNGQADARVVTLYVKTTVATKQLVRAVLCSARVNLWLLVCCIERDVVHSQLVGWPRCR
ncbi:hypothetical protein PHMEG_0008953 [Phytophthora megakarya]|uniref:Uncharacterized protein n=1 Tax=Phytophthora megakarya TaxID=4795 RepID=A0A225WJG5_9STRA|nr:hypothetical protein PHMEG_0008953 [Phytophthora megakarya]